MMLSLVANVGAVVHDLTPDYTAPGTSIDILSWDIYGPTGGVYLTKVDVAYNGTNPLDVDWANIYVNGTLVQTLYGPVGFLILNEFIPEGSMVTVTLEFVISSTATHGNHVDGKISDYTLSKPGGTGTDIQPIDPLGFTIIDATAPTLTKTLEGTMGSNGWWVSDVNVSLKATDLEFGVDYVAYKLNNDPWNNYTASYATTCELNFTISDEGNNSLAHRAYDGAGNMVVLPTQYIPIDKTDPDLIKVLEGTKGKDPWWGSEVKVTFTGSDAHSGVDYIEYSYNNITWVNYTTPFNITAAGTTKLYHRVHDKAGRMYELLNQTIKIDMVNPDLTKSLVGTMGLNGWYTTDVNVTLTGSDAHSGVDKVEYDLNDGGWTTYTGSFNITAEGNNKLAHKVSDNAGRSYVLPTQYIKIDKTAPTLSKDLDGTTGLGGWYKSDVKVTLNGGDAHSGVDKVEYNLNASGWNTYTAPFNISTEGTTAIQHRVTDNAGWVTVLSTQDIKIDKTLPTLTKDLVGTPGNAPWWVSDVKVTLNGGDSGSSGLDKVEYNLNASGWNTYTAPFNISTEGTTTIQHRVSDNAGNVYVLPTQDIKIDTIAPTVKKIEVSDTFIKEDDIPGTFNVTVTFSEAMNPLVIPSILFEPDVSTTLENQTGAWSVGDTVYIFTYDIADANVTVNDVNVTVGGAEDVAGNPDPLTGVSLFDIDTLHHAGEPEYIDVWADYSASMSITLNANEVAWPQEGLYSEWNSPEYALESDDEYAFLTKDTAWCFLDQDVTLRLNFEAPPEDLENYTITSVKLKVEQKIRSDFFAYTDDTWEFGVGDKNDCTWWWDTWISRPGTVEEHTMSIDITHEYWWFFPIHKLTWDDLKDIAVEITPDHDESESGEWFIDNVWLEVKYEYHDEGPSITVPVGGEANVYANVTDWFNDTVPDGTPIHFETDLGTVYPLTNTTTSGITMTKIISTDVGTATVNASGSLNGICEVTFVAHTLDVELSPGWNLISVPRKLENTSIEAVFEGITTVTKVYTYQNGNWTGSAYAGSWSALITGHPIEDIEDGIGYWVYATEPTTVTLSLEPLGYVQVTPPDYDLSKGWTMVGYTTLQLEPEMPVPVYLTNLDDVWKSLYRYTPAVGLEQAKPLDYGFKYTELGRGYWIYLNEVGVLVP